jgi:hypothetical protein
MASRKTYFGIGWPKDAPDPDSGAVPKGEPDDRSSPTVVDDEKVAEGLRQLRSWYQNDSQSSAPPAPEPPAASPARAPEPLGARPTAVGHATAPPASVVQRPVAPDPMRATMYGHDVHKFDLDAALAAAGEPPQQPQPHGQPPAATGTALVSTDPARQQEAFRQQAEAFRQQAAVQSPPESPSDPFQLARFGQGEAERLPRSARRSGAFQPTRPAPRVPVASRVMFAVGLVALTAAVVFWWQSGSGSESTAPVAAPAPTGPPSASTPPALPAPAPAPERAAVPSPSPDRPSIPATPTPIPAAPVGGPRAEQMRLSASPTTPRAPRHRTVMKPVAVEPTEVDEVAPPVADRDKETQEAKLEPKQEPKDVSARSADRETAKEPVEARETAREPQDKQDKLDKQDKKERKSARESKARSGDLDATLPPSLD